MRYLGSTIECYRGESFVVKREFVDANGTPLTVGSNLKNPFIRFTVKSNTYKIDGEQHKNYWLKYDGIRLDGEPEPFGTGPYSENVLYYKYDNEGNREYYTYRTIASGGGALTPYSFVVAKRFLNSDTKKWVGQIYQYEIALCGGELMTDWLQKTFESLYPNVYMPTANAELAHYICKKRPDLLKDVDITEPLVSYTTNRVLQGPSKLIVKEN